MDTEFDPVDHARTTRKHAGETFKDGHNAPGLLGVAVGVVSLVVGLAALATGRAGAGTVAIVAAAVFAIAGVAWLTVRHRRVREAELQWAPLHSDESPLPPSS